MAFEITSSSILSLEQLKTHFRVFAGPGAGKTHFLVENIKNIVTNHPLIAKSLVRKVLCITYTNAAVDEIKRRLTRFSDSVEVSTIHSFIGEHIIKPFQEELCDIMHDEFNINVDATKPITSQIEGVGILHGFNKEDIYEFVNNHTNGSTELSYSIARMGNVQIDIDNFVKHYSDCGFKVRLSSPPEINPDHALLIKEFLWSKVRKLTHNEILYFGYRILERNSTALYTLRVKFPFIFIDEFQDTNPLQTLLIKLLGEKSTIIGVIGDIAQSIYSFQGAKPSHFNSLTIDGARDLKDYFIRENRRSTSNIVEFCNFIRKADRNVIQTSIRPYENKEIQAVSEAKPVHFLIGDADYIKRLINKIIENGGVVLTRAWSKAFMYIRDISANQVKLLTSIYYTYTKSPIDIRAEITEIGNVTWVRAFKFIFSFHTGYNSESFIDVYNAFELYVSLDRRKFSLNLLRQIKMLAEETFEGLTDITTTVAIIEKLNKIVKDDKYILLRTHLLGNDFNIPIFDEYDLAGETKSRKHLLSQLTWSTSYKLFTEIFSKESRYMTVHQAKGLEWDKVVVSVEPSKFDHTQIYNAYSNPQILQETPAEEFVRIYYVACSRAKEDLYIHLPKGFDTSLIKNAFQNEHSYEIIQ